LISDRVEIARCLGIHFGSDQKCWVQAVCFAKSVPLSVVGGHFGALAEYYG
jgi:hypothetical protein